MIGNEDREELVLYGLNGTASHLDMRKIRVIGFFFEKRLNWQFEVEKKSTNCCSRLCIYLFTIKILIHNFLQVFGKWGKNLSHKRM